MVRLLIADGSTLVCEGFRSLYGSKDGHFLNFVSRGEDLEKQLRLHPSDVLIIDPIALSMGPDHFRTLKSLFPQMGIIAITQPIEAQRVAAFLDAGILGFLLKDCSASEIYDAVEAVYKKDSFLCGKVADVLMLKSQVVEVGNSGGKVSCNGLILSGREVEIIQWIAVGLSNKLIAEKLCLSPHTINTHRKNILQKLKINNTAGLVMFAVKHNLLQDASFLPV